MPFVKVLVEMFSDIYTSTLTVLLHVNTIILQSQWSLILKCMSITILVNKYVILINIQFLKMAAHFYYYVSIFITSPLEMDCVK